ncbi:MAG: glycosyltransferase [Alloprevotella sp.]|nr:glycosyltransferase [Alloprevotella sp.]
MKILHIINTLDTAGAERLVVDMAVSMRRAGHEIGVLSVSSRETPFMQQLRDAGIKVATLGCHERNPLAVFRLRPYLRGYDVIHVHLFPAQYWVAAARALFGSEAVFVTTEHNTYNIRCRFRLTTWTDRLAYRRYDAITCISPAVLAFMQERTQRRVPLRLIQNGVDTARFSSASGNRAALLPHVPQDAFVLMQVARFQPQKDQDCLIRALPLLPDDVHAVFVGGGEREAACRRLASELGVSGRTHFLGIRSDVPELLSVADVVIMSSHWEGFGLSAVEGMAAGKPVLASDVEGLAQVVGDERLLFIPGDASDLSKKVLSLRGNSGYLSERAAYCARRAEDFSIGRMVDCFLELYRETIDASGRSSRVATVPNGNSDT